MSASVAITLIEAGSLGAVVESLPQPKQKTSAASVMEALSKLARDIGIAPVSVIFSFELIHHTHTPVCPLQFRVARQAVPRPCHRSAVARWMERESATR